MTDLPIPPYLLQPSSSIEADGSGSLMSGATGQGAGNAASSSSTLPSETQLVLLCLDYLRDLRRSYTNSQLRDAEGLDADWLSVGIYGLSRAFRSDGGEQLRSSFEDGSGSLVQREDIVAGSGNDAWFDASSSAVGRQSSHMHRISTNDENVGGAAAAAADLAIPSTMDDINREILYIKNPKGGSSGASGAGGAAGESKAAKLAALKYHGGGASRAAAAAQTAASNAGEEPSSSPADPSEWYAHDDGHPSNLQRFYPLNGLASERPPLSLGEIAAAGLHGLGARSRLDAERDMVQSELFGQFISAVQEKGFFDGTVPGSATGDKGDDGSQTTAAAAEKRYEERYRKVVAKFRTKLAAKAAASGGGGAFGTHVGTGGGGGGGGSVLSGASEGGNSAVSAAALDAAERQKRRRQMRIKGIRGGGGEQPSEKASAVAAPSSSKARTHAVGASSVASIADGASVQSNLSTSYHQTDIDEAERLKSTGNAFMQKKDYDQAIESYTGALKLCPNGPTSHVYYSNRAAALLSMKKFEEAVKDSERSVALMPDYGKAHARLGLAHFLLGHCEEAVDSYEVAVQLDPDNKASRSYLDKARKKLAAQKVVEKKHSPAAEAAPPEPAPSPPHPRAHRPPSPPPQAAPTTGGSYPIKTAEQSRIDEKEANRYKSKGNACMASRDYNDAISAYTSALELCPDGPSSHVYYSNRAAALCYLERYEEAELDSETSVSLRPDYGKGYARLGLSRFFLNDYRGAVLAYQEALKYEPDNPASRSYLAKAMKKLEQEAEDTAGGPRPQDGDESEI